MASTITVSRQSPPSLLAIIKSSKKPENIWFRIYYSCAAFVTWTAIRLRWKPNQLTAASAILNFAAFAYFVTAASNPYTILMAYILFNVGHVFDCADGQLAYVANLRSERGYWLDSCSDAFKSAFIVIVLIKVIVAGGGGYGFGWLGQLSVCAVIGNLVDYAVSIHALRYRETTDPYRQKSFDRVLSSQGVKRYLSEAIISHLREHGNVLLAFALFAVNAQLALWCVVVLGLSHWMFALRRVVIINRRLKASERNTA